MDTAVVPSSETAASTDAPIPVDRINELYRGEIFTDETQQAARDRIHWMCAQAVGDTVLDVGCSQGIASILLAREGFNVTAVDTHPESVAYARAEFARETDLVQQRLKLVEADLASLPLQPGFDTILLGEVLEHQSHPQRMLRAATARLNAGGRIVCTTPFALHPHVDHKVSLFPRDFVEYAEALGLAVHSLNADARNIHCVYGHARADVAAPDGRALLALTESATLASQALLFGRLSEQSDQVRRKSAALKVTQKKLAELTEAEAAARAAAAALRKEQAQRAAEAQAARQKADAQRRDFEVALARRTQAEAEAAEARKKAEAKLRTLELTLGHELTRVKDRNKLLKERLLARQASYAAVKASTSFRLGRMLVAACMSPAAFLRLPVDLTRLAGDALKRRRERAAMIHEDDPGAPDELPGPTATHGSATGTKSAHRAVPAQLAQPILEERLSSGGVAAVEAHLVGLDATVAASARAMAALELGRSVTRTVGPDTDHALAELALRLDRSEPVLRGYFWSTQRTGRIELTYRAYRELETIYAATPSERSAALLLKLQRSPAVQLQIFESVVDRPVDPVVPVPGRVAYALHNSLPYSSGGYATRAHGVAGGLMVAGYDVVVLTRPGFPLDIKPELTAAQVPLEETIDGVRFVRTLAPQRTPGMPPLPYMLAAAEAVEKQLRAVRPAVVIAASNYRTALPALIAARRIGVPFVYEVRGFWEVTRISREPEYQDTPAYIAQSLLEAKVAQHADHVFTLTGPMAEELVARGVPADKIDLLPNSCDPSRFQPRVREAALAARLGIPEGTPVIGYIGTFVDYEGLEDLTLACGLLKARGLQFRLMLVGNENASGTDRGPITAEILRIAEAEGLSPWLIMPGRVPHDEVESYYSLIDVAPFPRKPWPVCEMVSPMKPLEAMAMEKAVLVSSVRALTELVEGGRTGEVFDKGDVTSMADTLARMIGDAGLRQRLGRAGREWVVAERTWTRIGRLLDERLRTLTGAQPAAQPAPAPNAQPKTVPTAAEPEPVVGSSDVPSWWSQLDARFRERCAFVDVSRWKPAADVATLRAQYVARFGEEAVAKRMPARNWSRADICARLVPASTTLLDVGSGLGEFVNLVAQRGRHGRITSFDRKEWDLWVDLTGTVERIHGDIFTLGATHTRDVVTCFEVIEHLPPARVAEAVRLLRAVARERLLVTVPFMEPLPLYKGHHTRFDHVNLAELFPDARFTVFGKGDGAEVRAWILCEVDVREKTSATDEPPKISSEKELA